MPPTGNRTTSWSGCSRPAPAESILGRQAPSHGMCSLTLKVTSSAYWDVGYQRCSRSITRAPHRLLARATSGACPVVGSPAGLERAASGWWAEWWRWLRMLPVALGLERLRYAEHEAHDRKDPDGPEEGAWNEVERDADQDSGQRPRDVLRSAREVLDPVVKSLDLVHVSASPLAPQSLFVGRGQLNVVFRDVNAPSADPVVVDRYPVDGAPSTFGE